VRAPPHRELKIAAPVQLCTTPSAQANTPSLSFDKSKILHEFTHHGFLAEPSQRCLTGFSLLQ